MYACVVVFEVVIGFGVSPLNGPEDVSVLDTSFAVFDVCVVGPVLVICFGVSCIEEGVTDVS